MMRCVWLRWISVGSSNPTLRILGDQEVRLVGLHLVLRLSVCRRNRTVDSSMVLYLHMVVVTNETGTDLSPCCLRAAPDMSLRDVERFWILFSV
jgi:hypothetical protein